MSEQEWKEILDETLELMKEHVEPFITPIWKYKDEEDILLHGSGSYLEFQGERFIVSNEHVAKPILNFHLTHAFKGNENIFNVRRPFLAEKHPIDVSISKVENDIWLNNHAEAKSISFERFSKRHSTVDGELLFFAGFSGERSKVLFDNCFSRGTPFLTRECVVPENVKLADPNFHLAIPYPPELAETKNPSEPLPDPHGFSGSLLWNTRRREFMQEGLQWTPSVAEVTAVIWGWPSSAVCVLATKIEHVNLPEMINHYHQLR